MKTKHLWILFSFPFIFLFVASLAFRPGRADSPPTPRPDEKQAPAGAAEAMVKSGLSRPASAQTTPALPSAGIVNGDFESGATGWTEYSQLGWAIIVTGSDLPITPHSGVWAAWLGGDHNEIAYIQQTVDIPAGSPSLSLWEWIDSEDMCGYDFAWVLLNGNPVATIDLCTSTDTGGWVQRTLDLSAYAGMTVSLQIQVETDDSYYSSYFVDDVTISGGGAGDQFVYLPITLRDYWAGFWDDFSSSNNLWCIEDTADYKMGFVGGEFQLMVRRPNVGYMCIYEAAIPISSYTVEVDARMVSGNAGSYSLVFGLRWGNNTRENYVVSVEPYTRYYRLQRRNMDGSWTTLVNWTYSTLINPGSQTNRLRIDRWGANIFFSLGGLFVAYVSDSQITGSGLYVGVGVNSYDSVPVDVRFDNFKVSMP